MVMVDLCQTPTAATGLVLRVVRDPQSGVVGTCLTGNMIIIPLREAETTLCLWDEGARLSKEDVCRHLPFAAE